MSLSTFTEHYLDEAVAIISNFSCCPLHELVWSCICISCICSKPHCPSVQKHKRVVSPSSRARTFSRSRHVCQGVRTPAEVLQKHDSSLASLGLVPLFWIVFEGRDLRWISWDPKRHLKKGSQIGIEMHLFWGGGLASTRSRAKANLKSEAMWHKLLPINVVSWLVWGGFRITKSLAHRVWRAPNNF